MRVGEAWTTLKDSAATFGSLCLPFVLFVYLLGAAALWARSRFLNNGPLQELPALIER